MVRYWLLEEVVDPSLMVVHFTNFMQQIKPQAQLILLTDQMFKKIINRV